jgi:hypothetical protein
MLGQKPRTAANVEYLWLVNLSYFARESVEELGAKRAS